MRQLHVFAVLICIIGCSETESVLDPSPEQRDVDGPPVIQLRIANESDFDFESLEVRFPNQTEHFGALAVNESTEYRAINGAYRYAYALAISEGRRFVLQPIDYVGESPLPAGRYTYVLTVNLMDEPAAGSSETIHGYMGVRLIVDADRN